MKRNEIGTAHLDTVFCVCYRGTHASVTRATLAGIAE